MCSSTLNWGAGGGGKFIFSFICPMYGLRLGAQIQNKFINSKSDSHYNSHRCTHPKNRFLKPEPQLKWVHHPSMLLDRTMLPRVPWRLRPEVWPSVAEATSQSMTPLGPRLIAKGKSVRFEPVRQACETVETHPETVGGRVKP